MVKGDQVPKSETVGPSRGVDKNIQTVTGLKVTKKVAYKSPCIDQLCATKPANHSDLERVAPFIMVDIMREVQRGDKGRASIYGWCCLPRK
jgi:hypothetical protein